MKKEECIQYKSGYKYQLTRSYETKVPINPGFPIISNSGYIELRNGVLSIERGYAWDGPSGPTFDTKNFMRGSLVHDALYQLMREGFLSRTYRHDIDRLLQKHCEEDGMWPIRRWWVYKGVSVGGISAADPRNRKQIKFAPKKCS